MIKRINKAFYFKYLGRYDLVIPNVYFKGQWNEMDIAAVRKSGFLDEIEIKMSLSDFKNDFKKKTRVRKKIRGLYRSRRVKKHTELKAGRLPCNYFYFLLSEELATECKIPEYAGLLTYKVLDNGGVIIFEKKAPKRLHNKKLDEKIKFDMCRKIYFKYWHG